MGWLFFVTWAILFLMFVWLNFVSIGGPNLFLSLLTGFLLSFTILIATYEFSSFDKVPCRTSEYELIQSGQYDKTEGSFSLGCGKIKDVLTYQFYRKTEDGAYILDYIECEGSKIIETEESPKVVILKTYTLKGPFSWWVRAYLGPIIKREHPYDSNEKVGILYVPKGTIITSFSDLNLN